MRALALALCLFALPAAALELRGEWEQGGVLVGRADPGTRVWLGARALRLSPQGDFVFGLDRDAPAEVELRVQRTSDPAPETFRYDVAKRTWDVQRVDGVPDDRVDPPASALPRIQREQKLLSAAFRRDTPRTHFTESMQWPATGRISGLFGGQRILNGKPKRPHYGVDVAVPTGTPIRAPAGGVVSLSHPDLYYTGGTVVLDHGHGLSSILIHLSKVLVKDGQEVSAGQVVAESGATGRASGPHLHWGLRWFESYVDAQRRVPPMPSTGEPQ